MTYQTNKVEYLDESGLSELWEKIKKYVADNGSGTAVDLSDYYTKEQTNSLIGTIDLTKYYTKTETDALLAGISGGTGTAGKDGVGIKSVALTNYELIVTLTDGTVTNLGSVRGATGETGSTGAKGDKGDPGTNGINGTDGISPTATVTTTSTGATISITDKNGTTTATITNGTNGTNGTKGADGTNGTDGISPTVVANSGNTDSIYKLDITDKNGTFTTPNLKGADGASGSGGGSSSGEVYSETETAIGTWLGSTLYRKVIHVMNPASGNYLGVSHGVSGIGVIPRIVMTVHYGNSYYSISGGYIDSYFNNTSNVATLSTNLKNQMAYCLANSTQVQYYLGSNVFDSVTELFFVIEYTKA